MDLIINFWTKKHIDDVIEMLEETKENGFNIDDTIKAFKKLKIKLFGKD